MAPIAVGDKLPEGVLAFFDEENKLQQVSIHSLAAGKKIILFGVPGAFTPTCSMKHVPGFVEKAEELKGKGIDEIICISGFSWSLNVHRYRAEGLAESMQAVPLSNLLNDPFVMKEWAKTYTNNKHVKFLADGSAKYTYALGLEMDLSEKGLGIRSRRFALVVDNLEVKVANIEEGPTFEVSSAEEILKSVGA